MKHFLLTIALVAVATGVFAQSIIVTGGPGRVNNTTVIKGQPFNVQVTGLNGTPQKWSAGIGTVQNQNVFFTSSTSVTGVVIDRAIDNNTTGLISVGATNGNGVSRYLTVVEDCDATLFVFCVTDSRGRTLGYANVTNATGATSYTWTVNGGTPFNSLLSQIKFPRQFGTNTVSVTINGGACDGEVRNFSGPLDLCLQEAKSEEVADNSDASFRPNEGIDLYPNPSRDGEVNLVIPSNESVFRIEVVTPEGKLVKTEQAVNAKTTLDVRDLPTGVYYLQVRGRDGYYQTRRLVIE